MGITISIASQKGGVGKSTVAINAAGCISEKGKKILVIDLDPQRNLSDALLNNSQENRKSVFELMVEDNPNADELIYKTEFPLLDIIPGSPLMTGIDKRMADEYDAQFIIRERLDEIKDRYDFVIIDCPPSLGLTTLSGLIASDYVIIPITMDQWAITGSNKINLFIQKIRKRANPDLEILGYIVNRFDPRRNLEKAFFEFVNSDNKQVFKTCVKVSVKYPEAVLAKKPINYYLPGSEQAVTFQNLSEEIIEKCQKRYLVSK